MSEGRGIGLWPTMTFRDADAMTVWLKAIGFTEHSAHRNESDPTQVLHAEMLWPAGGAIMFSSYRENPDWPTEPGTGAAYLVCDDPDGVFRTAVEAGGRELTGPRDQDYGGRGASVTDPEGNLWSFGSYQPG